MTRRIVIEEPDRACLHGNRFGGCASFIDPDVNIRCPGGHRTVIEPNADGTDQLVEVLDVLAEHRSGQ